MEIKLLKKIRCQILRQTLINFFPPQDEKELIRNLSSAIGGNEVVMVAEEYLNPGRVASTATLSTPVDTPLPSTPTQKFFPSNSMPPPPYSSHTTLHHRNSR
jgi:hypothetical protein